MKKYALLLFVILTTIISCKAQKKNPLEFLPKEYVVFEKIYGDLDNDGLEDCILVVKGTNKNNMVLNQYNQVVDRNRRGIIILFKKNNKYELVLKNYNCFSSENEDGGNYYPPQLSIKIEKGRLYVHYSHGRYGYWKYTFAFSNSNFDLIGYNATNGGAVISSEISINFITKKKLIRENINQNSEGGDENFKETLKNIHINKPIKLSGIKHFEELYILNSTVVGTIKDNELNKR